MSIYLKAQPNPGLPLAAGGKKKAPVYPCLSSHSAVSMETFTRQQQALLCKWMRRHVPFIITSPRVQPLLRMKEYGEHSSIF